MQTAYHGFAVTAYDVNDDGQISARDALAATSAAADAGLGAILDTLDAQDQPDPSLWPIFAEEAQELLPALAQHLRRWEAAPAEREAALAAMRSLYDGLCGGDTAELAAQSEEVWRREAKKHSGR